MNIGTESIAGSEWNKSRKSSSVGWIFHIACEERWYESFRIVNETVEWIFDLGVVAMYWYGACIVLLYGGSSMKVVTREVLGICFGKVLIDRGRDKTECAIVD